MKLTSLIIVALLLGSVAAFAQQSQPAPVAPPDWAQREFNAPADKLYTAALQSIRDQLHTIKKEDPSAHTVEFHVGVTAWSWGYNMILTITPIDESHAKVLMAVKRSGGDVVSWGSGKKEVRKIYEGMEAMLAGKANPHKKTG